MELIFTLALVLSQPLVEPLEIWDVERPVAERKIDPVIKMAERVSYCESGNRNIRNLEGSSASGYFQFIDSTWEWVTGLPAPAMNYSYETQLKAFKKLWDEGRGSSHWNPSRTCWQVENPWDHFER